LRLAVISPFIDRHHGTERCLVEQLQWMAAHTDVEMHIYSQRVEDLASVARYPSISSSRISWHKVSELPGPHLLSYLWWFWVNHVRRGWDSRVRGLKCDLLYSPGINALDADVVVVHIVFREFYRQVRSRLKFGETPISAWPRLLHRRLYYWLIMLLERIVYRRKKVLLAAVSSIVADQLAQHFGRSDARVIRNAVDTAQFSPSLRLARRASVRDQYGLTPERFVLLLIGHDWKKKGLDALLPAVASCRDLRLTLLVVGSDDRRPYEDAARKLNIADGVLFLEPSPDVMQFYAAADAYVAPSLEDAFGLPILEAMACGLPVAASRRAGASEIIENGASGILLRDAEDVEELARVLRALATNAELRSRLSQAGLKAAQHETWDRNAELTWELLKDAAARK
jgi:glycosyltransferase involved in cell wall biosynthesis